MNITIRRLEHDDIPLFEAHFERHLAESGRGGLHFAPYEPDADDGPSGMNIDGIGLPLTSPGWQRWFAAFTGDERGIIGHVDLKGDGLATGIHRCELGIGIERPYRGSGLGTKLMRAAVAFARESESIDWIDLRVFSENAVARALYRSLGFVEVGVLVDRFRIGATSIDDVIMTLEIRRGAQ